MTPSADETAATLAQAQADLAAAQSAHEAATAAEAGPRKPEVIMVDLLEAIVMHNGNHPHQRELLKELQAAEAPAEPTPAPEEQPTK